MGKLRPARVASGMIIVFLVVWPLFHISGMLKQSRSDQDAGYLLYQVSLFQMEMLANLLGEAENADHTGQLNALMQTAYSANYTHERLLLAVDRDRMAPLDSLPQLLQYIMRLQLGGERVIKPEELETLGELKQGYDEIYDLYSKLMRENSRRIIASANEQLKKKDGELAERIRELLP
ncbi:hypothetical protein [Paenibacillus senegalensis]|uniref:hypothetical protein n=1 Tax=Paenibacillus senegalensis TaxID=1465766 RepID=UPI0002882F92|nr:hypothetical protein [Paenibacillus senegalensis]